MAKRKFMEQPQETSGNKTIRETFNSFIKECRVKQYSPYTIKGYKGDFHKFSLFYDTDKKVNTLNQDVWNDFVIWLGSEGVAKMTVISYMKSMRTFFYWLMDNDYIDRFKIIVKQTYKPLKETYTDNELLKLLVKPCMKTATFAEYRAWVMINYFLSTGQRLRTVENIKIEDIDIKNRLVKLTETKNGEEAILPLSKTLCEILEEYMDIRKGENDDYLFCKYNGKQMTKRGIEESIRLYNHKRGVEKTSIHLFRHTFAKRYLMAGGDVFRLQRLLCHKDISITKEYLNLTTSDISKDFSNLNPLDTLCRQNKKPTFKMPREK